MHTISIFPLNSPKMAISSPKICIFKTIFQQAIIYDATGLYL